MTAPTAHHTFMVAQYLALKAECPHGHHETGGLDHAYVLAPVADESVGPPHGGCYCALAVALVAVALNWP